MNREIYLPDSELDPEPSPEQKLPTGCVPVLLFLTFTALSWPLVGWMCANLGF